MKKQALKPGLIHLWQIDLDQLADKQQLLASLLSADEQARAERFKFLLHRQRYSLARTYLRKVLSLYIDVVPQDIIFSYGPQGKPFLSDYELSFNLSHSHNQTIIAVTQQGEVGVDIEKIATEFKEGIAQRFFSDSEYEVLLSLPAAEKAAAFYHIWSKKEALIKALGQGLYTSLASFSVSIQSVIEPVRIPSQQGVENYFVQMIPCALGYAAAVASSEFIETVEFCELP